MEEDEFVIVARLNGWSYLVEAGLSEPYATREEAVQAARNAGGAIPETPAAIAEANSGHRRRQPHRRT